MVEYTFSTKMFMLEGNWGLGCPARVNADSGCSRGGRIILLWSCVDLQNTHGNMGASCNHT